MANQKDPVCGMQVDEKKAAGQSDYQGQTYYFCCQGCKAKFDQNPQQYATQAQKQQTGGSGRQ
ncbi:MAG TPA: YHS domain-containing protein [Blastocatellia bacterium]|nr:YHS domain-containing protein [Blastocatellia bacterium]